MMTRAEAQAEVALRCDDARISQAHINWDDPVGCACITFAHADRVPFPAATAARKVAAALLAYSAHLSYEAGRAFELAAVQRAARAAWEEEESPDVVAALHRLGAIFTDGLHHAEPKEA
jgi:hypothetical protein